MEAKQRRAKRILVLSGGGGRGAYQIGVLEYLEEVGWPPDVIIGSSVGAVNAAALGSGVSVRGLKRLVWNVSAMSSYHPSKSAKASSGRPACLLSQMQKLCRATLAAKEA